MTIQTIPPSTQKPEYTFITTSYPPILLSNNDKTPPTTTPRTKLLRPTPTNPSPATNHPVFTAAMHIRTEVFVKEQFCDEEGELDCDDERSWGWVVYAVPKEAGHQDGGEGRGEPVGTIRVVPPPHVSHSHLTNTSPPASAAVAAEEANGEQYDLQHEPYIKITRVAVLAAFRGYGLSRLLMRTVEEWASQNRDVIDAMYIKVASQQRGTELAGTEGREERWNGLIGLHAQVQVERMYAAMGYETDESMGRWDEEGIEHVGMFKRVDVIQT
jgi:predicted GNAT family N-acyltransferase